jgi:hypothetical protein
LKRFENNAAQIASEFAQYAGLLMRDGVKSYLEIGSQYGASLWSAAKVLPKGSRIVSVDMPQKSETSDSLKECISELNKLGFNTHLFLGDSSLYDLVKHVSSLGPFDCIFIDGDHTLPGVTADWKNYGLMGKMVAFHDIAWDKPVRKWPNQIEVCKLWRELKKTHRHVEFIAPGSYKGIGVLWN